MRGGHIPRIIVSAGVWFRCFDPSRSSPWRAWRLAPAPRASVATRSRLSRSRRS